MCACLLNSTRNNAWAQVYDVIEYYLTLTYIYIYIYGYIYIYIYIWVYIYIFILTHTNTLQNEHIILALYGNKNTICVYYIQLKCNMTRALVSNVLIVH